MVIKSDSRREPFERQKVLNGLIKACEKRPISLEKLENIVTKIELYLQNKLMKEVKSKVIGEMVMKHLHTLDEVAYVRFASVYRQFRDVSQFTKELKKFLK
jgi:transcriptional repressor NrdR